MLRWTTWAVCVAVAACAAFPVSALAYPAPSPETTATPVVGSIETTVTNPITLSDQSISDLAAAIADAATVATVTVPGTLTVDPWATAGLPAGWPIVLVLFGLAALAWGWVRVLRR